MGRTAGNPRPSSYGLLAHQRDQNRSTRTPSFLELNYEKNRKAPKTFSEVKETKKWFATTRHEDLFIFAQIHRLQNNLSTKRANVLLNSKDKPLGGSPTKLFDYNLGPARLQLLPRS